MTLLRTLAQSRFLRHVVSLSSGTALAQAIALGFLPVLSRLYTPDDFGALALYLAIVSPLYVLATFSYQELIMLPRTHKAAAQLVRLIFFISLLVATLTFFVVLLFREQIGVFLGNREVAPLLFFVPISVFFYGNYQALRYWTMRMQRFGTVSTGQVVKVAANFSVATGAGMPVAGSHGGLSAQSGGGLVLGAVFAEIASAAWLFFKCHRRDQVLFGHMRRDRVMGMAARHRRMAASLTASYAMSTGYFQLPAIVISSYFGAATLGFYAMAERIVTAPALLIANAVGDVYRQRASVLYRETGRFDQLMIKTMMMILAIGIVPYAIGIFFAPDIFRFVLGPGWDVAGQYASIMLVGSFFSFITTPVDKAAVIVGARRFIVLFHSLRLVLHVLAAGFVIAGYLDVLSYVIVLTVIRILVYGLMTVFSLHYAKGGYGGRE